MNSILSVLFTIMLFTTLFVECGSINQPEPDVPPAIPTVAGLPDEPEEIDNDIPEAYPAAEEGAEQQIESQSYPPPAPQNTPDPYSAEPESPTPYPDPES